MSAASAADSWVTYELEHTAATKPRVLLIHDMEGLSGQDDPFSILYGDPRYPRGQALLTDDVNAVIDGLFAGGAGSVQVADGHGSGNPEPDILVERLDARASMISRPIEFDPYLDLAEKGQFDAIALVGMHAKSGSRGFASHTYTIGMEILVNGQSITETELIGLLYGQVGVPVIFVSGDDRLMRDLETMPWLEYVTTKKAINASSADLSPIVQVHGHLRLQARRAIEQRAKARIMKVDGPLTVTIHASPPANMRWLEGMPGIDYEDERVSFSATDMVQGYRGLRPIVTALGFSLSEIEQSSFLAQSDVRSKRLRGTQRLYRLWFDAESGRTSAVEAAAPTASRAEYHGFQ